MQGDSSNPNIFHQLGKRTESDVYPWKRLSSDREPTVKGFVVLFSARLGNGAWMGHLCLSLSLLHPLSEERALQEKETLINVF